jgi:hypothetical protein
LSSKALSKHKLIIKSFAVPLASCDLIAQRKSKKSILYCYRTGLAQANLKTHSKSYQHLDHWFLVPDSFLDLYALGSP